MNNLSLHQKIKHLESYLNQPIHNYSDTFKQDIIIYFGDYFIAENPQFQFLNELHTQEAIEQKIAFLVSQFTLKFDSEQETENDFIHHYIGS